MTNPFGYIDTRNLITTGSWQTEAESARALDHILDQIDQFFVYREIRGYYLQPRLGQELKHPRIDRILVPMPRLIAAGWAHGPIGIECKRSGVKLGPPIAQQHDYSRAAWLIEPKSGLWVMLQWVFLWPAEKTHGPIASILAQHRLGTAETTRHELLHLSSGEQTIASFSHDGRIRIGAGNSGRKVGSR